MKIHIRTKSGQALLVDIGSLQSFQVDDTVDRSECSIDAFTGTTDTTDTSDTESYHQELTMTPNNTPHSPYVTDVAPDTVDEIPSIILHDNVSHKELRARWLRLISACSRDEATVEMPDLAPCLPS